MAITLTARHQQRTDTSTNWSANNPILLVGEIGIESNTGKIKVGNGVARWSSLAYIGITTEYLQDNYLPKTNPTVSGAVQLTDANSQITRNSVSPHGNNIGANGVMLTHYNSDEGGLLINEDGAYLWNSTDSGYALKVIDEDAWSGSSLKKDCSFASGLLLSIDTEGNIRCKGKFYDTSGNNVVSTSSIPASNITIASNSNLGSTTNLQTALNYIANVFAGTQTVNKIKAKTFDAV